MKYELMIRSIPTAEIGIPETHARIVSAMNGISPPWGFGGRGGPPAPDCGRELLAESKLSKHLGPGVRGSIVYSYRAGLRDAGMSDDFMKIEFNPTRQDYQALVQEVFPKYILAFSPYSAFVGDADWGLADWPEEKKCVTNSRYGIYRIYPVHFLGNLLCQRTFQKMPGDLVTVLSRDCEHVELMSEGVLIIQTSRIVGRAEADAINELLWNRLGRQRPGSAS